MELVQSATYDPQCKQIIKMAAMPPMNMNLTCNKNMSVVYNVLSITFIFQSSK